MARVFPARMNAWHHRSAGIRQLSFLSRWGRCGHLAMGHPRRLIARELFNRLTQHVFRKQEYRCDELAAISRIRGFGKSLCSVAWPPHLLAPIESNRHPRSRERISPQLPTGMGGPSCSRNRELHRQCRSACYQLGQPNVFASAFARACLESSNLGDRKCHRRQPAGGHPIRRSAVA